MRNYIYFNYRYFYNSSLRVYSNFYFNSSIKALDSYRSDVLSAAYSYTFIGILPPNCNFSSAIDLFAASNKINNSLALFYSFTFALFFMLFALYPNRRVPNVSLSLYVHIEQFMMRVVLLLPPKDSCRIRVNFESR